MPPEKSSKVDNIHFTLVLLRDHILVTISPRIHCLVVFSFFFFSWLNKAFKVWRKNTTWKKGRRTKCLACRIILPLIQDPYFFQTFVFKLLVQGIIVLVISMYALSCGSGESLRSFLWVLSVLVDSYTDKR